MHRFTLFWRTFCHSSASRAGIAVVLASSICLTACQDPAVPDSQPEYRQTGLTEYRQTLSDCIDDGGLTVQTFGAITGDIDWRRPDLSCEGMPRPHGQGARLRFAGELVSADVSHTLAFILSIPDLKRGKTGSELATRVTLIEEDNAHFFSTQETDVCWSNITQHAALRDSDGAVIPNRYSISGLTYCVAPIAELNGTASVTLSDLKFTGRLRWAKKK